MSRRIKDVKATYNSGELEPKLTARLDVTHYYTGASYMRNVWGLPQGGARRHGHRSLAGVPCEA